MRMKNLGWGCVKRISALLVLVQLGCGGGKISSQDSSGADTTPARADDTAQSNPSDATRGPGARAVDCSELTEVATPAVRIEIRNATSPERLAVCNDGSPAVYYMAPGVGADAKRWIIFLEGGVGCVNKLECLNRWKSGGTDHTKMSSKSYPATADIGTGIMSRDPVRNPYFHQWTFVYVKYCSSDYWSGANDTPVPACLEGNCPAEPGPSTWYFRGRRIVDALLEDLADPEEDRPSLTDATEVIWAGCSSGSVGAQRTLDHAAETIHQLNGETRVTGLFDAEWRKTPPDLSIPRTMWTAANAMHGAINDASCVAATKDPNAMPNGDPLCGKSYVLAPYIETPYFAYSDQLDSFILNGWGIMDPWGALSDAEQTLLSAHAASVRAEFAKQPHGFTPHENWHCAVRADPRFFCTKVGGTTYAQTFINWYFGLDGPVLMIDDSPLPWE